jgi:flagellar FliJ protein
MVMRNFRLEPVLRVRKHREDHAQIELAKSRALLEKAQQELARTEETRSRVEAKLQRKLCSSVTVSDVLIFQRYLDRLLQEVETGQKKVAEAREALEQRRLELTEKMKDRKVIDRLKENRDAAEQSAANRHEQAFINEVAVNRFARSL